MGGFCGPVRWPGGNSSYMGPMGPGPIGPGPPGPMYEELPPGQRTGPQNPPMGQPSAARAPAPKNAIAKSPTAAGRPAAMNTSGSGAIARPVSTTRTTGAPSNSSNPYYAGAGSENRSAPPPALIGPTGYDDLK